MPEFAQDLARIFAGHGPIERRVARSDGLTHWLVRIRPYVTPEHATEGVVVVFVDVTSLTNAEARQQILIAELQHRTRNLLTVVQAIAARTFAKDGARRSFSTRLEALGRVQTLVSNAASNDGIDLADIIHLELQAHGTDQSEHVTVSGPSTLLDAERVQTLALVLHELATKAVKYGALSGLGGQLEITWTVTNRDSRNRSSRSNGARAESPCQAILPGAATAAN